MIRMIELVDWNKLITADINICLSLWQNQFLKIVKACIPRVTLSSKPRLPWLTKAILRLIKQRNRLYKSWKTSCNPILFNTCKSLRNKIVTLLRTVKKNYFKNLNVKHPSS